MDSNFIKDPANPVLIKSEVAGSYANGITPARLKWTTDEAVAKSDAGLVAAVQDTGEALSVRFAPIALPCARNIRAVAGGTSTDIKAIQATVYGLRNGVEVSEVLPAFTVNVAGGVEGVTSTDIKAIQATVYGLRNGVEVSEVLPAFTVNVAGGVEGAKTMDFMTGYDLPPHDGTGATTSFGWGDKLGIDHLLYSNSVLKAYHNKTPEGAAPTVTTSANALESNGLTLDTALDGSEVAVDLMLP